MFMPAETTLKAVIYFQHMADKLTLNISRSHLECILQVPEALRHLLSEFCLSVEAAKTDIIIHYQHLFGIQYERTRMNGEYQSSNCCRNTNSKGHGTCGFSTDSLPKLKQSCSMFLCKLAVRVFYLHFMVQKHHILITNQIFNVCFNNK